MFRVRISEAVVKDATQEFAVFSNRENNAYTAYCAALDAYRAARKANKVSMFHKGETGNPDVDAARAVADEMDAAYTAAHAACKEAEEYANALAFVRVRQVENVMRRAIRENAQEFAGKPAHYKRTKSAIAAAIAAALDVEPNSVSVWQESNTKNLRVGVSTGTSASACATVCVDFWTGLVKDADSQAAWNKQLAGVDELTPAAVRKLARERAAALDRIAKEAESYRQGVHKALDKFAVIGETDNLRKAATVEF